MRAAGIVRSGELVAHADFADQLLGPGLSRQPALGAGFEDAAIHRDAAHGAARRRVEHGGVDALFAEIVSAGEAGDAPADYADASSCCLQGRNSRTIWTTAFTFSTGVSGRMPWPRLKMWPGRVPVRRSRS